MTLTPEQLEQVDRLALATVLKLGVPLYPLPDEIEHDYKLWLTQLLPKHFRGVDQFGPHHEQFWQWAWSIKLGEIGTPPAYLAIWPRGGNKSTSAEGFAVACGARGTRKFGLYVCRTQPQADSHVAAISSMILSSKVGLTYSGMANPKVTELGNRKKIDAWNRQALTTSTGFSMQGYGLQSAFRGIRIEEYRPDLIIISDVDDVGDSPQFVQTLLNTLAGSVLGTASNDCVVLFEQNLIHHNSMMNRILIRETDVLSERIEGGPIPALWDAQFERREQKWFVIAGRPSWVGQGIAECQDKINTLGKEYFERECQHDVDKVLGRPRFLPEAIKQFTAREPRVGELRMERDPFGVETPKFFHPVPNGLLAVWGYPQPGRVYAVGADTAEGRDVAAGVSSSTDPDYAVAIVRDANTGEQMARLRGRITEGAFGELLYSVLRWYNDAFLVPEVRGGYGRAMLNKLIDLTYPAVLIFNKHLLSELQGLPPYRGEVKYHDLGWDTNVATRPLMIQKLDDAILNHTIETYDAVTIEEYRHFCYNSDGKPEAEPGYHDDAVMADALCQIAMIFARKLMPFRKQQAARAAQLPRKYGQPGPKGDAEEEQWWKAQGRKVRV